MEKIILPSKVDIKTEKDPNKAVITIEPCYYGFGMTLGNALRRVLLSSIAGAAVTALKFKGATHEFSTLPHVKEDILEIVLNFKQLRLRVFNDQPVTLRLKASGETKVTAGDIETTSDVEIVNKNLHLATLTNKDAELDIEITVNQGRGYVTTESREDENLDLGTIAVDSIFTPVKNVGYQTENVRVGQITNYDKLILTLETDGTVSPADAFKQAVQILMDHFELLLAKINGEGEMEEASKEEEDGEKEKEEE